MSQGDLGALLTAAEVAERLGYTERYVWKLGREGVLARVKVPGRKYVRFLSEDVERFVRSGRQEAQEMPVPAPPRFTRRHPPVPSRWSRRRGPPKGADCRGRWYVASARRASAS